MTTPLAELYLKACEFDSQFAARFAKEESQRAIDRGVTEKRKLANHACFSGITAETDRRKPLDAKVADLIRACEQAKEILVPELDEPNRTAFWALTNALAALAEEVKGGE